MCAEFVVDATGHGIQLPVWLSSLGCRKATEDTVDIGIRYTTHQRGIPEGLLVEKVVITGVSIAQVAGGWAYYAIENDTWLWCSLHQILSTFPDMIALAPTRCFS